MRSEIDSFCSSKVGSELYHVQPGESQNTGMGNRKLYVEWL